ncbi:hypothetical protein E4U43_008660 [Claviceps pusilla]|uniref:Uncharacterized protein n=1 Tax=Claviceps pusilla TaxID=123648 RepID=A0A9P7NAL3_9HYPO|nr:hypothetical protein E4U43_008660 [Claviceps pusilla]
MACWVGPRGAPGWERPIFSMHYESKLRMVLGITNHLYIHSHTNSCLRRLRIENRHDYDHDHESDAQAIDLTAGHGRGIHLVTTRRFGQSWARGEPKDGGQGID